MSRRLLRAFFPAIAAFALAALSAHAAPDTSAEESRIAAERARAEADFSREERDCRARFAVTDCIAEARARRRERLADLHRQEVSLHDANRLQRAVDRARVVDERSSAGRQQSDAERRARARQDDQTRRDRAAERAAARVEAASAAARQPAGPKASAPGIKGPSRTAAQDYQKKQEEAAAHKAEVQKRLSEKGAVKPALPTLP